MKMSAPATRSGRTPKSKQIPDTDNNSLDSPKRGTKSLSAENRRKDKSPKGIVTEEETPVKDSSSGRTRRTSTLKDAGSVQTSAPPKSPARTRGAKSGNIESTDEVGPVEKKSESKVSEVKVKKSEENAAVSSASGGRESAKESPSVPSTPMAGIRRSGRAPVPSSKYKDMEVDLGSSRKRASSAVVVSEGSDAEPEPPRKRNRKTSERSQHSTADSVEDNKSSESAEEHVEAQSTAETSEDNSVPLSIEEMIQNNLSEAGIQPQKENDKEASQSEEVPISDLREPNGVVELSSSKQTDSEEVSEVVAEEEATSASPSVTAGGQQFTLTNENGETITVVTLQPDSEKDSASQEESNAVSRTADPNPPIVVTLPKLTDKPKTAQTSLSDIVTISPSLHGHVMSRNAAEPPFATVVTQDGATYLNLSVEATNISTILKGKHLSTPQKPSSLKGHGRVLRNPTGSLIVRTALTPPSAPAPKKEASAVKPAAPYSLLYPQKKQQIDESQSSAEKTITLPGSVKTSSQASSAQRVVVVRPADVKKPTGNSASALIGVAQAISKALGEKNLPEGTPTVIRLPQDLPSKKSGHTIVHIQTSPTGVAAANSKHATPAAAKTASEILLQRLREQQKRVIVKESVHTADAMVRESQSRQENIVSDSPKSANELQDAGQLSSVETADQSSDSHSETTGDASGASSETPKKQKISVLGGTFSKLVVSKDENGDVIQKEIHVVDTSNQSESSEIVTTQSSQVSTSEEATSTQDSSHTEHPEGDMADSSDTLKKSEDASSEMPTSSASLTELQNVDLTEVKQSPSDESAQGSPGEVASAGLDTSTASSSNNKDGLQPAASGKDREKVVEKIRIVDNGVEYDVSIVSEEEVAEEIVDNSTNQLAQGETKETGIVEVEPEIIIKQEMDDDADVKPDIGKQTSATQTVYSPRLRTAGASGMTSSVTHKLATVVEDGQEKKHVYYVSVIPNKGIMAKTRTTMYNAANWVMGENGMFCCEKCDYETDRKANFYKHRRSHSGFKPHVCHVCQYKAGTSSNLKRHMGIHKDIREHKCDICGLCFRQKIHLERHIKYKHEEKSVKCPMCDYICANEQPDLKMHIKRKHSNENAGEVLTCPDCKVRVGNKKDLKQHMKFHKEGPELKLFCKECSFVTDCQSRLKRHTAIHSKMKPFQCGVCNYRAAQKEHVLRHLRTQHKIEIKKDKKRPWRRHKKIETEDSLKERADFSSGDKIFACNHCTMRFAKLINLYKHLHTQHNDIMPAETDGNFYCVVCEYSTTNKKNLLVHMRRHNMADQTPPTHVYSCVLCRYVNPKRRNLFQHMRKKHNINISKQTETYLEGEDDTEGQEMEVSDVISSVNRAVMSNSSGTTVAATDTSSETAAREATGDLAGVASMIKIEDLTRTSANGEADDMQALVIDNSRTNMTETVATHASVHSADALEGLQALAEQAGLIDNIIEEQVPVMDEQQTVVIEQGGTSTEVVGNVEVIEGQLQQIIQSAETPATHSGGEAMEGLELTEEQLSSLRTGDMVEMEGELYLVEFTQDPSNPNKQLLSFLPVAQTQISQETQAQ